MVTPDNIADNDVVVDVVVEEVVEEVVASTTSNRSRSNKPDESIPESIYDAEWEVPDDYSGGSPPVMLDLMIMGYNNDGEKVGPFRVLAPDKLTACALVGIDISIGPSWTIN